MASKDDEGVILVERGEGEEIHLVEVDGNPDQRMSGTVMPDQGRSPYVQGAFQTVGARLFESGAAKISLVEVGGQHTPAPAETDKALGEKNDLREGHADRAVVVAVPAPEPERDVPSDEEVEVLARPLIAWRCYLPAALAVTCLALTVSLCVGWHFYGESISWKNKHEELHKLFQAHQEAAGQRSAAEASPSNSWESNLVDTCWLKVGSTLQKAAESMMSAMYNMW